MLYVRLPCSEIFLFAAFLVAPTALEPRISTVSKPFADAVKNLFANSNYYCTHTRYVCGPNYFLIVLYFSHRLHFQTFAVGLLIEFVD